jgi:hypothetical protein
VPFFKIGEQDGKIGHVCGVGTKERGGYKERMKEGEYGGNIAYSCMKMEKRDLLNLVQE